MYARRPKNRGHRCRSCGTEWKATDDFCCESCGRICHGKTWCCQRQGLPFTRKRWMPVCFPDCPVCEPGKCSNPLFHGGETAV